MKWVLWLVLVVAMINAGAEFGDYKYQTWIGLVLGHLAGGALTVTALNLFAVKVYGKS